MLPFSNSRSSTGLISNFSNFASRTPRATFSKSQNSAMLTLSWGEAIQFSDHRAHWFSEFPNCAHDSRLRPRPGHARRTDCRAASVDAVKPSLESPTKSLRRRGQQSRRPRGPAQTFDGHVPARGLTHERIDRLADVRIDE